MADLYLRTMYAGHPLEIFGLGTPDRSPPSPSRITSQRRRQVGAQNLVLAIAGKLSASEALDLAGRLRRPAPGRAPGAPSGRARAPFGTVTEAAGQQQALFRLGFVAPDARHEDRHAMRVLNALTSGASGACSRSCATCRGWPIRPPRGTTLSDAGSWYATAGVDPQSVEPALEVVRERSATPRAPPCAGGGGAHRAVRRAADPGAESNAARAARLAAQEVLGIDSREELVEGVRG